MALKLKEHLGTLEPEHLSISLAVQEMAEKGKPVKSSGILSTFDGVHWNTVVINAGAGIERGSVGLGVQQWMMSKNPTMPLPSGRTLLSEENFKQLMRFSKIFEEQFGPVHIEFAIGLSDAFYILQIVPIPSSDESLLRFLTPLKPLVLPNPNRTLIETAA